MRPTVHRSFLLSLLVVLALAQSVFSQTPGPTPDMRWHREVQAGPYASISTAYGGMEVSVPLFKLAGPNGSDIGVSLGYRSNQGGGTAYAPVDSTPGAGWFTNYEGALSVSPGGATQNMGGGNIAYWYGVTSGTGQTTFNRQPGTRDELVAVSGGYEVVRLGDRTRYGYTYQISNVSGNYIYKLSYIRDTYGNQINLAYNGVRLVQVTDASNQRYIQFAYNNTNSFNSSIRTLSQVTLNFPGGSRIWTIGVDTGGRLTQVNFPIPQSGASQPTIRFVYDTTTAYNNLGVNITDLYDLNGNRWHYHYSQSTQDGSSPFAYNTVLCDQFNEPSPSDPLNSYYGTPTTLSWVFQNGSSDPTQGLRICTIKEPIYSYANPGVRTTAHTYSNTFHSVGNDNYFSYPIKQTTDTLGNTDYYLWNSNDATLASYTDRRNYKSSYTYSTDNKGLIFSHTDPLNNTTNYHWTDDLMDSETSPIGDVTTYGYNGYRKLATKIADPNGVRLTTNYLYNGNGEISDTWMGNDNHTVFSNYDSYGNAQTVTDPTGAATTFTFDALNNKSTETPPSPTGQSSFAYDNWNRLLTRTLPDSSTEKMTYDNNSNLRTAQDGNGNTTTTTYDALNRPVQVRRPTDTNTAHDIVVTYNQSLDGPGNMVDGRGLVTYFGYEARGLMNSIAYPDGTSRTSTFDPNGNRIGRTDGKNQFTQYVYDPRNLLTYTNYPDGTYILNHYRTDGLRDSMTDPTTSTYYTWSYNHARQLTDNYQPIPATNVHYTYDGSGRRQSLAVGSMTWQYIYNTNTRLDHINEVLGGVTKTTATFDYYANSAINHRINGNSTKTGYTYDNRGRVSSIGHYNTSTGSDVLAQTLGYGYDNVNVQSYTDNNPGFGTWSTSFNHDRSNRLIHEQRTSTTNTFAYLYDYAYDGNNNRTSVTRNGTVFPYTTASNSDRLLSGDGYTLGSYDNNGTPGTLTGANGTSTFVYDYENQIKSLRYGNGASNTFRYTGDQQRVERVDNVSGTTRYIYDGSTVIAETDGNNTITRYHNNGINLTLANGTRTYYRENGLGSANLMHA